MLDANKFETKEDGSLVGGDAELDWKFLRSMQLLVANRVTDKNSNYTGEAVKAGTLEPSVNGFAFLTIRLVKLPKDNYRRS